MDKSDSNYYDSIFECLCHEGSPVQGAAAMARLSALMSLDPKADSKEENELELLALVIQDFERQTVPPVKADPVESILFRMDQMQLSRKDLIPYIGSISKVSEVLSRKRPLSLPMIRRLNQGLGIPADILIEDVETESSVIDEEPLMDFTRFLLKEMLDLPRWRCNARQRSADRRPDVAT